jgi:hypothetical protein
MNTIPRDAAQVSGDDDNGEAFYAKVEREREARSNSITGQFCRPDRKAHLTRAEGEALWRRLVANGYSPVPLKPGEKLPLIKMWPLKAAEGGLEWVASQPGVGLLCGSAEAAAPDATGYDAAHPYRSTAIEGGLLALDLDLNKKIKDCDATTLSPDEQRQAREAIMATPTMRRLLNAGALLRERPGAANCVVALRNDGMVANGAWSFYRAGAPAVIVELLAAGRQFCAYALHPSGSPYLWADWRSPETVPLNELPMIGAAELQALHAEVAEALKLLGLVAGGTCDARTRPAKGAGGINARALSGLDGPPPSVEEMRAMLEHLAGQDAFANYGGVVKDADGGIVKLGWREAGMALKAAYGDEVGFKLWLITHNSEKARADAAAAWRSFAPVSRPGDMTVASIIGAALNTGFEREDHGDEAPDRHPEAADDDGDEGGGCAPHEEENASGGPTSSNRRAVVTLRRAASIEATPISWVWPGWLARGKMHVIGGRVAGGKTTLALKMAATITTGGFWPDGSRATTGNVVIWSGEDDIADTLVPRLAESGADLGRVHFVMNVIERGKPRAFDPANDMAALRDALAALDDVALLIVDPIVSAVGGDSHKNSETRRSLQPLVDLASSKGAALLGVTHFSKGTQGREPTERITGSLAFGAVPRVVMVAFKENDREDGTPGRRIFARAKSNIGRDDGGFTYSLELTSMGGRPDIEVTVVKWGEHVKGSAKDMLAKAEADKDANAKSTPRGEARKFLLDYLADGPKPTKEVEDAARADGHALMTLRRAKVELGVVTSGVGMPAKWFWSLPREGWTLPNGDPQTPTPDQVIKTGENGKNDSRKPNENNGPFSLDHHLENNAIFNAGDQDWKTTNKHNELGSADKGQNSSLDHMIRCRSGDGQKDEKESPGEGSEKPNGGYVLPFDDDEDVP